MMSAPKNVPVGRVKKPLAQLVEEAATPKRKIELKPGGKANPKRKLIVLEDPTPPKRIAKIAPPPPIKYFSRPVVEESEENWDLGYAANGVDWSLTEDLANLKSVFSFKLKQLTGGRIIQVFAQILTTRETSRSIQFKFCSYGVRNAKMVITPMAAITMEHYLRSARATFQFHLMDRGLAKKTGLKLDTLLAACRIAFKLEDPLVKRNPEDDEELMDVVADVLESVMLGVEEKEREEAILVQRQKKFSRDVHGQAWVERDDSCSFDGNQELLWGKQPEKGVQMQMPSKKTRQIVLPDKCAIL